MASKRALGIFFVVVLSLFLSTTLFAGEVRTYKEKVKVPASGDEFSALQAAKQKAKEQALQKYVGEVYPGKSEKMNLGGDDRFIDDIKILESNVGGLFSKEMEAVVRVGVNEEAVRDYLKRQGTTVGKNEDRRIFVVLIPGKIDSGDAPVVLDNIRAEIRKNLTAAEFTVIDDPEQTKKMEALAQNDIDYNKLASKLEGLGEWLVLGKIDMRVSKDRYDKTYRTLITGKAVTISSRDLLWEGNIDGVARGGLDSDALIGLRASAVNGGKKFADEVLKGLQSKTLTAERRGSRYEVVMKLGGDYRLERKALKMLKEDIAGLKNVSQKQRGKGDLIFDVYYTGKVNDLVDLLDEKFEKDPAFRRLKPQIDGYKIIFK